MEYKFYLRRGHKVYLKRDKTVVCINIEETAKAFVKIKYGTMLRISEIDNIVFGEQSLAVADNRRQTPVNP